MGPFPARTAGEEHKHTLDCVCVAPAINTKLIMVQDTAFLWCKHSSPSAQTLTLTSTARPLIPCWARGEITAWSHCSEERSPERESCFLNFSPIQIFSSMHRHPVINNSIRDSLNTENSVGCKSHHVHLRLGLWFDFRSINFLMNNHLEEGFYPFSDYLYPLRAKRRVFLPTKPFFILKIGAP